MKDETCAFSERLMSVLVTTVSVFTKSVASSREVMKYISFLLISCDM